MPKVCSGNTRSPLTTLTTHSISIYAKPPASTKQLAKLTYNPKNFPPLPTNKNTDKPLPQTPAKTTPETTQENGGNNSSIDYTPPKIDLDAIQKDLERSLREDFQHLINKEIGPLRQDIQSTRQEFQTTTNEL